MLGIARSRIGDAAELHHHDLAEPLTFLEDASVDLVVASLVFHYLRDWSGHCASSTGCSAHRVGGDVDPSPGMGLEEYCPTTTSPCSRCPRCGSAPERHLLASPLTAVTGPSAKRLPHRPAHRSEARSGARTARPSAYHELTTGPFFMHLRLRPAQPDGSVSGVC